MSEEHTENTMQKCFIKNYLEKSKESIKSSEIKICIGSEACDPDSFISSIAIAAHEKAIPVVNMKRNIFESKEDLQYICRLFNISNDDLIYLERPKGSFSLSARILGTYFAVSESDKKDVTKYKLEDKKIFLILVDHHNPVEELRHFEIDMIIDHHAISEASLYARRLYIDIDVGSCCTLVSKFIGHSLVTVKNSKNGYFEENSFCKHLSKMLSIPILLDTNRFKKVTSHFDRGEFKKLIKIAEVSKEEVSLILKNIKKLRLNDENLDTETILLKDFKKFDKQGMVLGYSTVKYPFEDWVKKEAKINNISESKGGYALETAFNTFKREYGLDYLMINRKIHDKRYLIMISCPFEKMLVEIYGFKQLNYNGLQYYEIDANLTRKILALKIKEILNSY